MKNFFTTISCCMLMVLCISVNAAVSTDTSTSDVSTLIEKRARGAYLTRVGNCRGCHTAKGGKPFAGGYRLPTSFGIFVTPNITSDKRTGIGLWNEDDFWQAIHQGKSRDGTLLYPAFPYTEYTKVTREDASAIFSYLQSLPAVSQINPRSELKFPYNYRPLLYIWRALYFEEGSYQADTTKSKEWNRGAYLVQGLGHCNACHTTRNLLGASQDDELAGGQIMGMNWYAPSLTSHLEAGSGNWSIEEIVELLTTGISKRASISGPMGSITRQSLQHLSLEDMRAMAVYLKSLAKNAMPVVPTMNFSVTTGTFKRHMAAGEVLYKKHCEDCHGASGKGVPGIYPPLAGNRSVVMHSPLNTIRSVLNGGFPPTTKANPRPYGMPPFQHVMRDEEIALIVSYIRNAWGNRSSWVTAVEVDRSKQRGY